MILPSQYLYGIDRQTLEGSRALLWDSLPQLEVKKNLRK